MAFFDKLNQVAKNLGDKTSDAIETTKLNSKINSERNAAEEELKKIGEYYYNIYLSGGNVATEVLEACQNVNAHYDAIEAAQAEINGIKAEKTTVKAIVSPAQTASVQSVSAAENVCSVCGAVNAEGTKFCFECGNKLEAPAATTNVCPNCGAELVVGLKFCGECGTKIG